MIDHEKLGRIQSGEAFIRPPLHGLPDLSYKSIEELLDLRRAIDKALPSTSLQQMNLEEELVLQYHRVVELQAKTLSSEDIPANQQAQVTNSVASILQQLVKMQSDLGRDEQLKRMETSLLEAIETLPDQEKAAFFERYEVIAEKNKAIG